MQRFCNVILTFKPHNLHGSVHTNILFYVNSLYYVRERTFSHKHLCIFLDSVNYKHILLLVKINEHLLQNQYYKCRKKLFDNEKQIPFLIYYALSHLIFCSWYYYINLFSGTLGINVSSICYLFFSGQPYDWWMNKTSFKWYFSYLVWLTEGKYANAFGLIFIQQLFNPEDVQTEGRQVSRWKSVGI